MTPRRALTESQRNVVALVTLASVCVWGTPMGFETFQAANMSARSAACHGNLRQLAMGMLQYAEDYDRTLPPSSKWFDLSPPASKRNLTCSLWQGVGTGYAMSEKLSARGLPHIQQPAHAALLFDADVPGWKAATRSAELASPPRHGTRWPFFGGQPLHNNVAYADGHVARAILDGKTP